MADTSALDELAALRGTFSKPKPSCLRCAAQEAAIIPEAQLKILVTEDWADDMLAFHPRAMNQEQAVAAEMLSTAIARAQRAFGVELLGARLNSVMLVLRDQARRKRITDRIIEARTEINARARAAYLRTDLATPEQDALARQIEAEPTPDYPGKARDDAYLGTR